MNPSACAASAALIAAAQAMLCHLPLSSRLCPIPHRSLTPLSGATLMRAGHSRAPTGSGRERHTRPMF